MNLGKTKQYTMSEGISLKAIQKVSEDNGDPTEKLVNDPHQDIGHENKAFSQSNSSTDFKGEKQQEMTEYANINGTNVYPDTVIEDKKSSIKANQVDYEAQNIPSKENYDNENSDDEEESSDKTGCLKHVGLIQNSLADFWEQNGDTITKIIGAVCIVGYAIYFAYAMSYEFGSESSIRLLWMTLLGVFITMVVLIRSTCGEPINTYIVQPPVAFIQRHYKVFKILFFLAVIASITVIIVVEVALQYTRNLVSLVGYVVFVALFFVFSANPAKVRWRPVLWGLGLQFLFALLVLKTVAGYNSFKWIGDRVAEFMEYTDEGSIFVFGESYEDHFFAMKVMPVVVFFSTTISVLYYLGIMEIVISKIAWVMQNTMGTTAAESTNAAGNIFIGQTEAPLLIRPMIGFMTNSEIHAVMVGGFATIAGSVLATYILLGVPANHLVTASVMAAPCALAMSKLSYPETQKTKKNAISSMERPPYRNVIEAASAGASASIPLVANIIVNIIAFIAIIAFFNTTLTWMGHRVGLWAPEYPELTFQLICSYLLWPFAFLMGVAKDDCRQVAQLIGVKTFVNEFVAYTELGKLIDNSDYYNEYVANNGTDIIYINDDIYLRDVNVTLYGGVMEERSIVVSTYALCGFANVASIGTVIGALGSMAPNKKSDISGMALRAMITGTAVSFMNACLAGLLYEGV